MISTHGICSLLPSSFSREFLMERSLWREHNSNRSQLLHTFLLRFKALPQMLSQFYFFIFLLNWNVLLRLQIKQTRRGRPLFWWCWPTSWCHLALTTKRPLPGSSTEEQHRLSQGPWAEGTCLSSDICVSPSWDTACYFSRSSALASIPPIPPKICLPKNLSHLFPITEPHFPLGITILFSSIVWFTKLTTHPLTLAWIIRKLFSPDHRDWLRDGHVIKHKSVRASHRFCLEPLGNSISPYEYVCL